MGIQIQQSPWLNRLSIVGQSTSPYSPEKVIASDTSYEAIAIRAEAVGIGFSMVTITNEIAFRIDSSTITRELEPVHYTEFEAVGFGSTVGVGFTSADAVADYINNLAAIGSTVLPAPRNDGPQILNLSAGNNFNYKADFVRGGGYFWTALSSWAEVSPNDARVVSGIATTATGSYQWTVEVENFYGITTSVVNVNVT